MDADYRDYLVLYQNWLFDMPGRNESWTVYLKRLENDLWHVIVDSTFYDGTPMEEDEKYTLTTDELISWICERDSWLEGARQDEPSSKLMELFEGYLNEDGEPFDPGTIMPNMREMLLIANYIEDEDLLEMLKNSCFCMTPEQYKDSLCVRPHEVPVYDTIPASSVVIKEAKFVNIRYCIKGVFFYRGMHMTPVDATCSV